MYQFLFYVTKHYSLSKEPLAVVHYVQILYLIDTTLFARRLGVIECWIKLVLVVLALVLIPALVMRIISKPGTLWEIEP